MFWFHCIVIVLFCIHTLKFWLCGNKQSEVRFETRDLKGHSQLYYRADLDTSFPTLKKVPLT